MFTATTLNFQVGSEGNAGNQIQATVGTLDNTNARRFRPDRARRRLGPRQPMPGPPSRPSTPAIDAVSTTRGSLGAVQNRFESTIRNLQVTTENLSASESRIRDTDMAAEMVEFTKNQILQQAGTAMLGQANQIPQSILQLLQ